MFLFLFILELRLRDRPGQARKPSSPGKGIFAKDCTESETPMALAAYDHVNMANSARMVKLQIAKK